MNRIDRLFAILLRISDGKLFRAEDLASRFELSERTIYRDLKALGQMGIPIRAEAGVGYQLKSGYFLPPLLFDKDEALAAGLALKFLVQSTEGPFRQSAQNAFDKLQVVLPKRARQESSKQLAIVDYVRPANPIQLGNPLLLVCSVAIHDRVLLEIRYRSWGKEVADTRLIEPVRLFLAPGANLWYLEAFCRTRNAWRSFRVDRIEHVVKTNQDFLERLVNSAPAARLSDANFARLVVRSTDARWVRERQHWSFVDEEAISEEMMAMTYRNFEMEPFVSWVLSISPWVKGVEPDSLKLVLKERVRGIETLLT